MFRIIDFSPIGFLQKKYPIPYCSICRGFLTDVCENCSENHLINCEVIEKEKSYYHKHCFDMIIKNEPNFKTKNEQINQLLDHESDEDSDQN